MPWGRSAVLLCAVGALLATGCAGQPVGPSAESCVRGPAELETPPDGALFGVNLDWGSQTIAEYSGVLERRPAVAVAFAAVPLAPASIENIEAAGEQLRSIGGTLLLTLEPTEGLEAVTQPVADEVATVVSALGDRGVPVVVRFAHEMNGSWYPWGQQPAQYIATFRKVAETLAERAPGSQTMWAPNYAGGYPFAGGPSAIRPDSPDLALADTDSDGVLTAADDAYSPYYPGDDVVDWVGMSLYHWGSAYPWGENELPEPGKFAAQLTGAYVGAGGDESSAPNFYTTYGIEHGKPVAIVETSALVADRGDVSVEEELAIKQAWWRQIFSADIASQFPQIHMVNWFEWRKEEPEIGGIVDWRATGETTIRDAFVDDLPPWLIFAGGRRTC